MVRYVHACATDSTLAADLATALNALPTVATTGTGTITNATNPASGPIVITTTSTADLLNGEEVTITNDAGNNAPTAPGPSPSSARPALFE